VAAFDDVPASDNLMEERKLMAGEAGDQEVGSVKVLYTPRYLEETLREHLIWQLLTFAAFGTVLALGLYALLWRTVLRPLVLIERYASDVSSGHKAQPVAGAFRGELSRLRNSIQKMVEMLEARYGQLARNQEMLAAVLNSTPQSIFWKDRESRYLGCNEPFAKLAGLARPEDIVGKTDFDMPWRREDSEVYRTNDRQVMTSGVPQRHVLEPLHAAGGIKLVIETTKVPLRDDQGNIYGVLGVFEDMTDRLESERQFRTFIEEAPVPIVLVPSPDGRPLYFNPAFTRDFGFTLEDIQKPEDWWPHIYPEESYRTQRHANWRATVDKVIGSGEYQDTEEALMHTKAGQTRVATVRICMVGKYRMSFLNDLTARRQAETELRLTQYSVDHNPIMVFRINMDGRFVYANDAACRQFGYSPAEMFRLHVWDVATVTTRENWAERAEFFRQERFTMRESWYVKRDGSRFPAEVRIQFIEFGDEKLFFVFGIDITQRKAAQEAEHAYTQRLARLATELTRSEERQRREFAVALHDGVGQNLFAATTQLLALKSRNGGTGAELDRTLALLDQITRDTREMTFELCPPVLYQLGLMPALQRLAAQFTARYGAQCTLKGTTAGPEDLNLRGLAYQTVRELLNNTAKHAGATHVTISAQESDGFVDIQVADNGRGFDPVHLKPGSGGFGVFHLRERIDLLGGAFEIHAAPGQGCRVQFTVPMKNMPGSK